jgi:dTDP-4-amino-4,6-dideoxygalactose transaminase
MPIPLFDIHTPLEPLQARLAGRAAATLERGSFILGPEVEAFEREFADYLGVEHVVGVANGTDALTIALRAMGVGPGDDVVVPAFTFYASAEAIPPTGARPVFCDVDRDTMMVTAETVKAALTPATKAVIAVHLFGNVAPVASSKRSVSRCSRTPRRPPARAVPTAARAPSGRRRRSASIPPRTSGHGRRRRDRDLER